MASSSSSSTSFVLKTTFQGDTRRVRVEDVSAFDFRDLHRLLRRQFGKSLKDEGQRLPPITYMDDEGDVVTVVSTEELAEAFRVASATGRVSLKLALGKRDDAPSAKKDPREEEEEEKEKNETSTAATHWGFTCDVSGMHPIVGTRYHKRGENYDLCEAEFAKLSPKDKDLYEKIETPVCGRWWGRFRDANRGRGRCGWRRGRGGGGRGCSPPPHHRRHHHDHRGRHHHHRRNALFRKIKWFLDALRRGDEKPLLDALRTTGGAAAKACEPLNKLVQAIRQDKTMDAVKRMRRSPAVHGLKRKLREIQDDIWAGKATLFEAPAALLNSSEWAVAVAQLREACPRVAEAVEALASLAPRLQVQLPLLIPRLLPVLMRMAWCCGGGSEEAEEEGGRDRTRKTIAAKFVRDETLPDGSVVRPETAYTKTWVLRNTGSDAWPASATLLHVGGDMELRAKEPRVAVGSVEPGKEASVSVELTTPKRDGRYWSYWRLVAGDDVSEGEAFRMRVWADLSVKTEEEEKATPKSMLGTAMVASTKEEAEEEEDDDDASDDSSLVVVDAPVTKRAEEDAEATPSTNATSTSAASSPHPGEEVLRAMGFDPDNFRALLEQHKGDVEAILNEIFDRS